jgi:hypothetical protein
MIWNAKAVNRSSKCNPGSQPFWFEKSLPVDQRKSITKPRFGANSLGSDRLRWSRIGQISGWESAEQANVSVSALGCPVV